MDVASRVLEVVIGISARCASPIDVETTCREIAELVGDAQAAERERCAKIVDNYGAVDEDGELVTPGLGHWGSLGEYDPDAEAIARHIRGGHT
jgi:hypothetical protein